MPNRGGYNISKQLLHDGKLFLMPKFKKNNDIFSMKEGVSATRNISSSPFFISASAHCCKTQVKVQISKSVYRYSQVFIM